MKFLKYISVLAAGVATLTSCSSGDNTDFSINTAQGVGVSVEYAEMTVTENRGIFNVPILLTGEPNGYVRVNVRITGTGSGEQAIADSHFYVTSQTIMINPEEKQGNIEIRTQNMADRDPDRFFNVVIESADGATIEPLNTTTITITDKLNSPIYMLQGKWDVAYTDYDGVPHEIVSDFEVVNETTGECIFRNFLPALISGANLTVYYRKDPVTEEWNMSLPFGISMLSGINFGSFTGYIAPVSSGQATSGEQSCPWNQDRTAVSIPSFYVGAFSEEGYQGAMDVVNGCTAKQQPLD